MLNKEKVKQETSNIFPFQNCSLKKCSNWGMLKMKMNHSKIIQFLTVEILTIDKFELSYKKFAALLPESFVPPLEFLI